MADEPTKGCRVILAEKPYGHESRHYPLTVGRIYRVLDLEGSCVHVVHDEGRLASIWRGSVRVLSDWEKSGAAWVCECDGIRFSFTRAGRGWFGKAYYDSDEISTTAKDRDGGVSELYEMVRHNRARAELLRRADAL